jgi:glycosyltransferase involved in cell wall biosynthesis
MARPGRSFDGGVAEELVKRVLMIAYHFPPIQGSSGVQRTLKFCQYLPDHGWQPLVLTVHPRAYEQTEGGQLKEIPEAVIVKRAFALDTARHLGFQGRYIRYLALPDRWISWWLGAVASGLGLIRRYRPDVIWSTYPIATAHLIGLTLHRITGVSWIADFRDSMTEDEYPHDPVVRKTYRWIEGRTIAYCTCAVFTTAGTVRMYRRRYPAVPDSRWKLIANGYDEENFRDAEERTRSIPTSNGAIVLLHSGLLYPSERDPTAFFAALSELVRDGRISSGELKIVFRASGYVDHYRRLISHYGIEDIISLQPAISYVAALAEMVKADGLLIFQASNCNHQVPAKLYEYLRAQRPILALTDPTGDTASILREAGVGTIVPLDSQQMVAVALLEFLGKLRRGSELSNPRIEVERYSRRARAAELAQLLEQVVQLR